MISAFSDFHAFWRMGGYAAEVWPAYAVVFLVFLMQIIVTKKKFNRLCKLLYRKYANPT